MCKSFDSCSLEYADLGCETRWGQKHGVRSRVQLSCHWTQVAANIEALAPWQPSNTLCPGEVRQGALSCHLSFVYMETGTQMHCF